MKLISWNVNGLRAAWKKGLPGFMAVERPDLLCVHCPITLTLSDWPEESTGSERL